MILNKQAQRGLVAIAALSSFSLAAFAADSFTEALTGGKASGNLRYRYETVAQKNALKDAKASTLRLRLGYETAEYQGFGAFVEAEHLTTLGSESYNSTINGKGTYSVVADPEFTEINQSYLSYSGLANTRIKYGRQRLLLDNQRFVGNVGWRQNEQTFDAFTVVNQSLPDTTITAGYISNVNRVFSDDSAAGNFHMKSPIVNASYKGLSAGELTGYAYFLDFVDAPAMSSRTLGLRFTGAQTLDDGLKLPYAIEYAKQSDYKKNPANYDVDYLLLEGGLARGVHSVKLGYEKLEGNGSNAFQTPLATLHAFNGWADMFLATPAAGLKDAYLAAGTAAYEVKFNAVYHDYRAENTSARYGTEWDMQATKGFGKHYVVGIKYADYKAKTFAVDTRKFWLWGEVKF
ncbi:MAG: alginate export family protein [Georgfuchsia sp.]